MCTSLFRLTSMKCVVGIVLMTKTQRNLHMMTPLNNRIPANYPITDAETKARISVTVCGVAPH